jgi:YHS domain-containing protein
MQENELVCILDGAEYKEYELLTNSQLLGVISWKSEPGVAESSWYTTASDGQTYYFPSKEAAIDFLKNDPVKSTNETAAKLKAEAKKIINIAEELQDRNDS